MKKETLKQQKKRINAIVLRLIKEYPDSKCSLVYRSPFQLLVATILSATDAWTHRGCQEGVIEPITEIHHDYLKEAWHWNGHYEDTIRHVFKHKEISDLAQKIENHLRAHDDGVLQMTDLHAKVNRNIPVFVIDDAINQLVKKNIVRRRTGNTGRPGRPPIYIELAG